MIFFILAILLAVLVLATIIGAVSYSDDRDFWSGFLAVLAAAFLFGAGVGVLALFIWLLKMGVTTT